MVGVPVVAVASRPVAATVAGLPSALRRCHPVGMGTAGRRSVACGAMGALRARSVLEGAIYTLVISGTAGVGQAVVDNPTWRGLLFLVVLFGLFFGGFVAGRGNFGSAARHGAAAAAAAIAVFQGGAAIRRLLSGEGASVVGFLFVVGMAAVCGSLGGLLATRSPGPEAVRRSRRGGTAKG